MIAHNEGSTDRFIRSLGGSILAILAIFRSTGILQIAFGIISILLILTAITGYCGGYSLIRINTLKAKLSQKKTIAFIIVLILVIVGGIRGSLFFSKKFFLEDFSNMNNVYKQLLFTSGKEQREETIKNYESFVPLYTEFARKYTHYKPFPIKFDQQFDKDLTTISQTLTTIKSDIYSGNLTNVHKELEGVRTITQDMLKRNGFSLLTVALVDFHDVMEILIAAADEKNPQAILETYPSANEKLLEVETNYLNDDGIKQIRTNLETLKQLATENKNDELSAQAQVLKTSFIKVYLHN